MFSQPEACLFPESYRYIGALKLGEGSLTFASWNLIGRFLHGLEHLRRVA